MIVASKKMPPARKMRGGEPTPKPMAESSRIPAPLRGLDLSRSIATPEPGGASVLDNWICDLDSVRPRKGYTLHATVAADAVETLFTYKVGGTELMFAASDDSIFDISNPADETVIPTAAVSGQTSGFYSTEQFGTAGGDYLYALNGTDSPQLFDGTTWTAITGGSSPAITGVTTSGLSFVWSFANRLFFVEKGTMDCWYLPVDSIGGAASQFSLAGVFKKGGSLLFGATWSLDSGDGPNEQCVFISTEGEVAVYRGTNPGVAADWSKVGVYSLAKPMGARAMMKAGGDLLVATEIGLVPLSQAIRKDPAALSLGAISRSIESLWQKQAKILTTVPWQIAKWSRENVMVVTQPETAVTAGTCLVANLQTGAWSRFTGLDTQSITVFSDVGYFGNSTGKVYKMQSGGADAGMPYTATYLGLFEGLDYPGVQKTALQARATFVSNTPIEPQFKMKTDYEYTLSPAPSAVAYDATDGWDVSAWDTSLWDAGTGAAVGAEDSRWVSIGATGYAHAVEVQLTFGNVAAPDIKYIGADITHQKGALVA